MAKRYSAIMQAWVHEGEFETHKDYFEYLFHKEDGPAVEYDNGTFAWYYKGRRHRLDGPALKMFTGVEYWFVNGKRIDCKTQREFDQLMKLQAFW